MAFIAVTYTFSNSTVADATQVNQNFQDIIDGLSNGTKDLSVSAVTAAGNLSVSGNTTLGNASSDDITFTGSMASSLPIKTTNSFDIGSSTLGLRALYFGANSQTVNVKGSASMSATWTFTLPVSAGTANYFLQTNGSGVSSWAQVDLATTAITGTLPVGNGGTGLTSGSTGGILYYSANGTLASTGTLTASKVLIGGGAGAAPSSVSLLQASSTNFYINTTTIRNGSVTSTDFDGNTTSAFGINDSSSVNGAGYISFLSGGTYRGNISNNNNAAVAYNTSSDYRLKEDVKPMQGALERVMKLKPCTFKWKENKHQDEGFIAHELQEVFPNAVCGEKDAVNADGTIKPQAVDPRFLVAALVQSIQELKAELDELKKHSKEKDK